MWSKLRSGYSCTSLESKSLASILKSMKTWASTSLACIGKYGIRSTFFGEFDKFGEGRLDHYIYKIYIY